MRLFHDASRQNLILFRWWQRLRLHSVDRFLSLVRRGIILAKWIRPHWQPCSWFRNGWQCFFRLNLRQSLGFHYICRRSSDPSWSIGFCFWARHECASGRPFLHMEFMIIAPRTTVTCGIISVAPSFFSCFTNHLVHICTEIMWFTCKICSMNSSLWRKWKHANECLFVCLTW